MHKKLNSRMWEGEKKKKKNPEGNVACMNAKENAKEKTTFKKRTFIWQP